MSLMECPHCAGRVSVCANACPQCGFLFSVQVVQEYLAAGADNSWKLFVCGTVIVVMSVIAGLALSASLDFEGDQQSFYRASFTETPIHTEPVVDLHAKRAYRQLQQLVSRSIALPESVAVLDVGFWDHENSAILQLIFSANNQFGERYEQTIMARTDIDGNLWSVLSPCPRDIESAGQCERLDFYSDSMLASLANSLSEL